MAPVDGIMRYYRLLRLHCEPADGCLGLVEGWRSNRVIARDGRRVMESARCASRITLSIMTLCLSRTAFAGWAAEQEDSLSRMPAKSDKYVDKALVRCAPRINPAP